MVFRKKNFIEHEMWVLIFSATLSETFLILRRVQRDTTVNLHASSCKVPCIFVRFDQTGILLQDFQKILKYQIHEYLSSGSRAVPCRQTDR
jgi:hypothetical protein